MTMMKAWVFCTLICLAAAHASIAQLNDATIRQKVLRMGVINKEFVFGKSTENKGLETRLTYMGRIKTRDGRVFKVMNYVLLWGLSKRATNRILIFNGSNRYVGNYYVDISNDLPTELRNGKLVFGRAGGHCNPQAPQIISFKNGLPASFYACGKFMKLDTDY
jgi:hypothetical protein